MNILINFSTLKSGGGQNVGMNFLRKMECHDRKDVTLFYFVAEHSDLHRTLKEKNQSNYYVVPGNPIKRMWFELFFSGHILKEKQIDIIYSYFGFGLFPRHIPQVSGAADSNLYFPEIDFWKGYGRLFRAKKKLTDWYRLYGVKHAAAVVFENEVLEKRALELFHLKKTVYIKPSINFDFNMTNLNPIELPKNVSKGLFLCGWHLNKNVHRIPEIAFELKQKNHPFLFVITASENDSLECKLFKKAVEKYDVADMVKLIGPVSKETLPSLYSQMEYVVLLSKLESFSNNIIESWYFKKPLIVADEPWARSICKEAACFVDRNNPQDIAYNIISLEKHKALSDAIIHEGMRELALYPSIDQRIQQEIDFLKDVFNSN